MIRRIVKDAILARMARQRGVTITELVNRILLNTDRYGDATVRRANAYKQVLGEGGKVNDHLIADKPTAKKPYINYGPLFRKILGEREKPEAVSTSKIGFTSENTAPSVSEFQKFRLKDKGGILDTFDEWDAEEDSVKENTAPSVQEVAPQQSQQPNQDDAMNELLAMQVAMMDNEEMPNQMETSPQMRGMRMMGFNQPINTKGFGDSEKQVILNTANKHGIPPEILAGVYGAETNFGQNNKTSSAGAQGYFQFMPATAREYGVNPNDFSSAADGASRYLKTLYNQFGNWEQAVAAYNAGPGNVKKGRYPTETQKYVPKVLNIANSIKFENGGTYDLSAEEIQELRGKGYKFKLVN
jgi:hypothetical protein